LVDNLNLESRIVVLVNNFITIGTDLGTIVAWLGKPFQDLPAKVLRVVGLEEQTVFPRSDGLEFRPLVGKGPVGDYGGAIDKRVDTRQSDVSRGDHQI
jgi:hypothetical protein